MLIFFINSRIPMNFDRFDSIQFTINHPLSSWKASKHLSTMLTIKRARCATLRKKILEEEKKEEGWLNTVGSARAVPPVRPGNRERERETSLSPLFGGKKGREIPRKTRLHCSLLTSTIVGDLSSHGELHEKYFCCRMNKENGQPL